MGVTTDCRTIHRVSTVPKKKLFTRSSYTKEINCYNVTSNERSWKLALNLFHQQWRCIQWNVDGIDYPLAIKFKSQALYTCYCECQEGTKMKKKDDPNLIIIRLHCPKEKQLPFLYKVTIRKSLVSETYNHFTSRNTEIIHNDTEFKNSMQEDVIEKVCQASDDDDNRKQSPGEYHNNI